MELIIIGIELAWNDSDMENFKTKRNARYILEESFKNLLCNVCFEFLDFSSIATVQVLVI